jgi:hypothetical protein
MSDTPALHSSIAGSAYVWLVAWYRSARSVWRHNPQIRNAAGLLGMSEREYCDRYVQHNFGTDITLSSGSNHSELPRPLSREDVDRAFDEAGRGGV